MDERNALLPNSTTMEQPIKISVDRGAGQVTLRITGSLSQDRLEALMLDTISAAKDIEGLSTQLGRKITILLDLTEFDETYDAEAINIMAKFAKCNANFVKKTAVFGATEMGMISGETIFAIAERENIRFFQTKEDAAAWLVLE